jgi:hypothetical protein
MRNAAHDTDCPRPPRKTKKKGSAHSVILFTFGGWGDYTQEPVKTRAGGSPCERIAVALAVQNAAHGTYSALAAMPTGGTSAIGALGGGGGQSSHANGPAPEQLTPSQQAAQAALTGCSGKLGSMVPVRTGLAWASLGGLLALHR